MSMQIDDPKFALRYWPVRDTILALSAHYKRRPTDPNDPFLVIVPVGHREAARRMFDGFDVYVVESGSSAILGMRADVVIFVGQHDQLWTGEVKTRARVDSPMLHFPW